MHQRRPMPSFSKDNICRDNASGIDNDVRICLNNNNNLTSALCENLAALSYFGATMRYYGQVILRIKCILWRLAKVLNEIYYILHIKHADRNLQSNIVYKLSHRSVLLVDVRRRSERLHMSIRLPISCP